MKTLVKIFSVLFPSFFSNGKSWLGARELTADDFEIEVIEQEREKQIENYLKGWGDYVTITIRMVMKASTIKALDEMPYFGEYGKVGFDNLSDRTKKEQTTYVKQVSLHLKSRLKTPKGGYLKSIEKIIPILDKTNVELRTLFAESKENLINEVLTSVNKRVQHVIDENNQKYKRGVIDALTSRSELDNLLNINKGNKAVDDIRIEHEVSIGRLDGEIEVYKKKIAELEAEKTEVYIETSNKFFGDNLEKVPTEVMDEVISSKRYPKVSRGFSIG